MCIHHFPLQQALDQFDDIARMLLSAMARAGPLNTSPAALLALLDHKPLPQAATSSSILHASYYKAPPPPPPASPAAAAVVKVQPELRRAASGAPAMSSTASSAARGQTAAAAGGFSPPALAALGAAAEGPQQEKGFLTLISSSCGAGLEVQDSGSGSWVPLVLGPGELLVMVGHCLTVATAGTLPTARWRAVSQT